MKDATQTSLRPGPWRLGIMAAVLAAALALGLCLCLSRAVLLTEALPMVLLAIISGGIVLRSCQAASPDDRIARTLPWLTTLAGLALLLLNLSAFRSQLLWLAGLYLLAWSFAFRNLAPRDAMRCWLPLLVSFFVLPYHEQLMLICSQPFRLASAIIAEYCVRLFNYPIARSGSSLMVNDHEIVITYACSGLNQLYALLLVGYAIVQLVYRRTLCKVLHLLLTLPIIVYVNALRLIVTILLFRWLGDVALQRFWHDTLGYAMVIVCTILFWYAQGLFVGLDRSGKEKAA